MKRRALQWGTILVTIVMIGGCGGSGYRSAGPSVGVGLGFYHHGYGGWGSGYYRGYDHGTVDAVDTIDTIDAIDAGGGDMGMPDFDMGPSMDFDF